MFWKKKKTKIVVHNGKFHADDVFSVAALSIFLGVKPENLNIKRTRDSEIIKKADYVFDVGLLNDGETRFDHHQKEGAGIRENGIPYASFGSMWKKFGEEICNSKEVADRIDKKIIIPLDADDNGVDIIKSLYESISPFTVLDLICHFNPTGKERSKDIDILFLEAVKFAKVILEREIKRTRDIIEEFNIAEKVIKEKYEKTEDKRILIIEEDMSWREIVNKFKEPLFVIKKNIFDGTWRVYSVRDDLSVFKSRKDLPENWAGKEKEELSLITGVKDAMFCHTDRFVCAAKTFEGAMEMAKIAVNNN